MSHWVVVADAAHARVFAEAPERGGWDELAELGSRSDARFEGSAWRGGLVASSWPSWEGESSDASGCLEVEVAEALRRAQDQRRFDWLVLAAAPARRRALRAALDPRVTDVITLEVDLELADLPAPVVEARLAEALAPGVPPDERPRG